MKEFVVDYYNSIQIADTRRFLFIAMYPELYPPLQSKIRQAGHFQAGFKTSNIIFSLLRACKS
jgi:hypothetical protein